MFIMRIKEKLRYQNITNKNNDIYFRILHILLIVSFLASKY